MFLNFRLFFCLVLAISSAQASTVTFNSGTLTTIPIAFAGSAVGQTISTGPVTANWAAPQFNPALGQLLNTTFTVTVNYAGTATISNPNGVAINGPFRVITGPLAFVEMTSGGALVPTDSVSDILSAAFVASSTNYSALANGSTVIPLTGSFALNRTYANSGSNTWCLPQNVSCIGSPVANNSIGTGTFNVQATNQVTAIQTNFSAAPFTPSIVMDGSALLSVSVTYEYNAISGVPEPGAWVLVSSGGLLFGFRRRFRRAN